MGKIGFNVILNNCNIKNMANDVFFTWLFFFCFVEYGVNIVYWLIFDRYGAFKCLEIPTQYQVNKTPLKRKYGQDRV